MRNRFFILTASLILCVALQAQAQARFSIEPRVGLGTYRMPQMKQLQQEIRRGINVPAKATEEFPVYFNYGLIVSYHLNEQNRISLVAETGSTGGRVTYADYSGNLTYDQLLQYKSFGSLFGREFGKEQIRFAIGLESTILFSELRFKSDVEIYGEGYSEADEFKAIGVGLKPFIGIMVPYKRFESRFTAGYLYNDNKPFYLKDDEDVVLMVNNEEAGPDWSGLRLTISVGYTLWGKH